MHLHILPHHCFFLDVLVLLGVLMLLDVLVLLDVGKEVEVCKEDEEGDCICTHRLGIKSKDVSKERDKFYATHQGHNLGVTTVKEKGKECVEEYADKLDHLQSCQVPDVQICVD